MEAVRRFERVYGGDLRKKRTGRGARPLSTRDPLHVVFKINREAHRPGLRSPMTYALVMKMVNRYARRFLVKVVQISIQFDHIHVLIRTTRRSNFHHFFRVVAGQIAQQLPKVTGTAARIKRLWKHRPFSRIVWGLRDYQTVRDYIQLNEKEARCEITYQKFRLKGMSPEQKQMLWAPSIE